VVGVAHTDGGDAVLTRAASRFARGMCRQHLADAVLPVDDEHRAAVGNDARLRHGMHAAGREPGEVPAGAQHAMRGVAPEVGLHQRVGEELCVGRGDPGADIDLGDEVAQTCRVDERGHALIGLGPRRPQTACRLTRPCWD
jgi:hypothetical protein